MQRRHYGQTKAQRQADWLARFSDIVTTADARHAGRIDWPTALHLFHQGLAPTDAARQYVTNRPEGPDHVANH